MRRAAVAVLLDDVELAEVLGAVHRLPVEAHQPRARLPHAATAASRASFSCSRFSALMALSLVACSKRARLSANRSSFIASRRAARARSRFWFRTMCQA